MNERTPKHTDVQTPLQAARLMYRELRHSKGYASPLHLQRSYEKRDNRRFRAQISGLSQGSLAVANGKTPTDAITVTRVGARETYRVFKLSDLEKEVQSGYSQAELPLPSEHL